MTGRNCGSCRFSEPCGNSLRCRKPAPILDERGEPVLPATVWPGVSFFWKCKDFEKALLVSAKLPRTKTGDSNA